LHLSALDGAVEPPRRVVGRTFQVPAVPCREQQIVRRPTLAPDRQARQHRGSYRYRPILLALRGPYLEPLANLNRVAMQRDTPFQELDFGDGQCDRLTPPQSGEREHQNKVGVTTRLLGQSAYIGLGEIDVALRCLLGFLAAFEPARRIESQCPVLHRVVEDARQDADRAVDHRGTRPVSGHGRGPRLHVQAVHLVHGDRPIWDRRACRRQ
jgi:hypothetical protein